MISIQWKSNVPSPRVARYDPVAIGFHWSMFMLVVVVGTSGLLHDSWPKQTQSFWINMHAMLGLVLWLLLMIRFGWRTSHAPPLLLIPIIGIVTFVWHGRVFDFGLVKVDFGVKSDRTVFPPRRISTDIWPTLYSPLQAFMRWRRCGTTSSGATAC